MTEIQAEPSVARWWGPPNKAELRRQAEGSNDEKALAIEMEGELVGLIQYREEKETDFRHAGSTSSSPSRSRDRDWEPTRYERSRASC